MYLNDVFTLPCNLAGLPGMSAALRLHPGRAADRPADPRPPLGRGARAAHRPGLRAGARLPPARAAAWGAHERLRLPAGHRARGARAAPDPEQDLLRLLHRVRRPAQHPHLPGVPGAARVCSRCSTPQVVEFAVRAGLALGCRDQPGQRSSRGRTTSIRTCPRATRSASTTSRSASTAQLDIDADGGQRSGSRIRRIHMEEDAGKNVHDVGGGDAPGRPQPRRRAAGRDRQRARPALRATRRSSTSRRCATSLVYLGVNDGNLEEGSFRCDANVSVMRKGATEFGTRVELKNINSFRFVQTGHRLRDRRARSS